MQHRLAPGAREMVASFDGCGIDDVASISPLVEIWQGSQDRLYSRLFQS
jgi:urease accessory protein UreF